MNGVKISGVNPNCACPANAMKPTVDISRRAGYSTGRSIRHNDMHGCTVEVYAMCDRFFKKTVDV